MFARIFVMLLLSGPLFADPISLDFVGRSGTIQELPSLQDVLTPADQDPNFKPTLIALDTDNTILEAAQSLGNESWGPAYFGRIVTDDALLRQQTWMPDLFAKFFPHEVPRALTPAEAFAVAVRIFEQVHRIPLASKLVEPSTAVLLRKLQLERNLRKGIRLMDVTAARGSFIDDRSRELGRLGVDFGFRSGSTAPFRDPITFLPASAISPALTSPRYAHGILHTSFLDKGLLLTWFFLKTKFPERLIFIDDNRGLGEQVCGAMEDIPAAIRRLSADPILGPTFSAELGDKAVAGAPRKVPTLCFRYSAADLQKYGTYDGILSAELAELLRSGRVLSDAEASRLILDGLEKR